MPRWVRYSDVIVMASLAVVVRLAFWAVTGRVWEDALITLAHARNAVAGIGLTHHPGEPPTQGFTSALSVLIPLVGEAVSRDGGLIAIRAASLVAVVVAVVTADALGRRLDLDRWPRLLVMGYLAVDANHVFFGMSGMETEVAVAALLVSAWAFTARAPWAGIALGVALLARPDFLIWAGIVVALLALRDRARLVRVAVGALAVVGPWVVFTSAYYGSPIPQTIIAKTIAFSALPRDASTADWAAWLWALVGNLGWAIGRTFAPFLEDTLAIKAPIQHSVAVAISVAVAVLALIGAVSRWRTPAWTPIIGFVGGYLVYRVVFIQPIYSDWYMPPFTAMTAFLVAAGIQRLATGRPAVSFAAAAALILVFALPLPWMFGLEREIQATIEDGVRIPVSDALADLVAPGEAVASESAGYVGYHSNVLLQTSGPHLARGTRRGARPPACAARCRRSDRSDGAAVDPPPSVRAGCIEGRVPRDRVAVHEVRRKARDEIEWGGYCEDDGRRRVRHPAPSFLTVAPPPRSRPAAHRPIGTVPRRLEPRNATIGSTKNGRFPNEYQNLAVELPITVG